MTKKVTKARLIVALDVATLGEARRFVRLLKSQVQIFKVGLELFSSVGPEAIQMIHEEEGKVFLDLKFHDIPNTVSKAIRSVVAQGVFMTNVHAQGGREMLEAASKAAAGKTILLGVTRLTSDTQAGDLSSQVVDLSKLAQASGLSGVVCSAQEAAAVREACGDQFVIVTPGIRQASGTDDQKRTGTAREAVLQGSNYLVVGRPILQDSQPQKVVELLLSEIS